MPQQAWGGPPPSHGSHCTLPWGALPCSTFQPCLIDSSKLGSSRGVFPDKTWPCDNSQAMNGLCPCVTCEHSRAVRGGGDAVLSPVCNTEGPGHPCSCFMGDRLRGEGTPERLDSSTGLGQMKWRKKNTVIKQDIQYD